MSYDARRTRLHAKAWLFSRQSSLDTAYVGSANLSQAALFGGHEWMVKASAADLPAVIAKFRGTFETLWNDPEFESFNSTSAEDRSRLRGALARERGTARQDLNATPTFFTLTPYPFQVEILERLNAERTLHGRTRNLLVAATGTGKTVIAAFDYWRRTRDGSMRPRLLFLAHREELLAQARATFRNVLRDGSFGELLAGGREPEAPVHLFATIHSFTTRRLIEQFGADYWDHVIIDECHHVPAPTYRAVVETIRPTVLIGLTATPERMDGGSLLPDFDNRIAAELRLWHAMERQLLVPFEYYGISDNTDLSGVTWTRGSYVIDALDNLYTGNDRRAELVITQTARRAGNVRAMRALGFCVSVAHAEFMAKKFSAAGIPAVAVHGRSEEGFRRSVPQRLERREVNVVFTCDLYNEGVDFPFVDTLLLLRPTSSSTLFLQQLGRGLRLYDKKESCLVLDFIGQHREEFRFDRVLSAMTGLSRGGLRDAVERGFPTLPSGCHLDLDRVAREQVLASLRRTLQGGLGRLTEELRSIVHREGGEVRLATFLTETGRDVRDVFTDQLSWSRVKRAAGLPVPEATAKEPALAKRLRRLLHIDEPGRLECYADVFSDPASPIPNDDRSQRWLLMLGYQLFHERSALLTGNTIVERLREHPAVCSELVELLEVLEDRVGLATAAGAHHPDWPLATHRQYGRREVLTEILSRVVD